MIAMRLRILREECAKMDLLTRDAATQVYMYLLEAGELDDRRDTFVRMQLKQVGPSSVIISYVFPSPIVDPHLGAILVGEDRRRKGGRAGGP